MDDAFFRIAERKIQEAVENGELEDLPGKGKPLAFEDSHIPEDLRAAYKILKNNGILPVEMDLRREIVSLEKLIMDCDSEERKEVLRKKLTEATIRHGVLMDKRRRRT